MTRQPHRFPSRQHVHLYTEHALCWHGQFHLCLVGWLSDEQRKQCHVVPRRSKLQSQTGFYSRLDVDEYDPVCCDWRGHGNCAARSQSRRRSSAALLPGICSPSQAANFLFNPRRLRKLLPDNNLWKLTAQQKIFCIFLLTRGVVFGSVILDCGRFTCDCGRLSCDCGRLSCGGGRLHFGRRLSRVGHAGSRRPDADFPFGLFPTGG